ADTNRPMFNSVLAGLDSLRAAPPRHVFVLPIDCPAARKDVWEQLAATDAVAVPTFAGTRGHPVCMPWSFVTSTVDEAVRSAANLDAVKLNEIITPVARSVEVDDPAVTTNLNTAEDVRKWIDASHRNNA